MNDRSAPRLLPVTVVGSYPQPDWLIDRDLLKAGVPRTRLPQLWRVAEPFLQAAQDDATILAVGDMERAGVDIVTDGEMRRESYSNRFATALEGVDGKSGSQIRMGDRIIDVPCVVGRIRRRRPVEVRDMQFFRRQTERLAKVALPGPFTLGQQTVNAHYRDAEEMTMDFAAAVNEELLDLQAAGADAVQLDEPWLRNDPAAAKRCAVKAINRALEGITLPTVIHLCFGYAAIVPGEKKPRAYSFLAELAQSDAQQISVEATQPKIDLGVLKDLSGKKIILGVIDPGDPRIEDPATVAARIRRGLDYVPPENLIVAPDCGLKYLARATAFGKLRALSQGAAIVRNELGGATGQP